MDTKVCTKCKEELGFEMFTKTKGGKYGLKSICKRCVKQWADDNKEAIAKRHKKYNIDNKIYISERTKQRYQKDKQYYKDYYQNNKEHITKYKQQYNKDNKEVKIMYSNMYYELNKGTISKRIKQYQKDNKEKCNAITQKHNALKKGLESSLTDKQWQETKQHFNDKCCYCGKRLPLTYEHFIPVTKSGEYTVNNIIPSCQSCNSSKSNKDFFAWYPKYKYYSKRRENFILKFLNYKNNIQQLTLII